MSMQPSRTVPFLLLALGGCVFDGQLTVRAHIYQGQVEKRDALALVATGLQGRARQLREFGSLQELEEAQTRFKRVLEAWDKAVEGHFAEVRLETLATFRGEEWETRRTDLTGNVASISTAITNQELDLEGVLHVVKGFGLPDDQRALADKFVREAFDVAEKRADETKARLRMALVGINQLRSLSLGAADTEEGLTALLRRMTSEANKLRKDLEDHLDKVTAAAASSASEQRDSLLRDSFAKQAFADVKLQFLAMDLTQAIHLASRGVQAMNRVDEAAITGVVGGPVVGSQAGRDLLAAIDAVRSDETRQALGDLVFFGSRQIQTAFGNTVVEVLDPADPRLKRRTVDTKEQPSILAASSLCGDDLWETVFDRSYSEADGRCEMILVQESPIHYRIKSLENDPTAVVSLQMTFAQQAVKVLTDVVGAAASAYGIPAGQILERVSPLKGGPEPDDKDAAASARAKIEAGKEILRSRRSSRRAESAAIRGILSAASSELRNASEQLLLTAQHLAEAQAAKKTELTAILQQDAMHVVRRLEERRRQIHSLLDSWRKALERAEPDRMSGSH